MKARSYLLALSIASGVVLAQSTPSNSPSPSTPAATTPSDTKAGATSTNATAMPEMKTTTFKGVLVDMACSSGKSAGAEGACPVSANSSSLGMKLDDGKTVPFDMVGNQRAQDALKNDKRWSKDLSANKPIHAKVEGVMSGDKLIVASIH